MREVDVRLADGSVLHAYDVPAAHRPRLTLAWHHGSPQTGAPLPPVIEAAAERGIRVFSYARPAYGGSDARTGRDVASAAADVAAVADALGIGRFAAMGASGGAPHALASGALLPERVPAVVTLAGIAPFTTDFDWFAGMASPDGIRSAFDGRAARAAFEETAEFDPAQFLPVDYAALEGPWSSLGDDVARAGEFGMAGLIDDDVAFARPWGFELADVPVPVLVVQGEEDRVVPRSHGEWMARQLPRARLVLRPGDGHISVLAALPDALDWLLRQV